jgi:spermidine/putrescine transport system substrate-binding protein
MTRRTLFFTGVSGLAGCARDTRPRLNVYNWSAYVAPETVPDFEREYGVRVRYSIYESNEEMLAKVLGGNSGWDVVFPTHSRIEPMRANGLLAPLNRDLLPNLRHLDARFATPVWDPALAWSVPYLWIATGILYNRKVQPEPKRWSDLWDARLRGRLTMLDDPEDMLGACLKKLGLPFGTTDEPQLRRAAQEAIRQKPLLRAYLNAEVRDQVVAGDVLVAQIWNTSAGQAMAAAPNLGFAYPEEGFPFYCDCAAILRESRRPELAHKFIDYLLRPAVAARVVTETHTATPNGSAHALLPPEVRANPTLYPPPEVIARGEWPKPLPPATQRLRDRLWTEIKSA